MRFNLKYPQINMPLPDESRPGRASDLIKRFQAAVDTNKEAPLQVSSSFASPSRPRVSSGGTPTISGKKVEGNGAAAKKEEAGKVEETDSKEVESEQVHIRSAGLDQPPTVPVEQQGRKNAQEAFPDMQSAPTQEQADALASREEDQPSNQSESPQVDRAESPRSAPIAVTQPSVDVPPQESIPGSTDSIARRSPSPVPLAETVSDPREPTPERLSPVPNSPIVAPHADAGAKEGLSRPTSPSADPSHLRSPPLQDDNSPPPSRSLSPEPLPPAAASAESTHPEPESKPPSSPVPHATSNSTSSKPLPKPSSSTSTPRESTSPSQTRTRTVSPTTQKVSPTSSRKPASSSSTSPSQSRPSTSTSPTSSRSLLTPTASSLAKARPRVNSTSSNSSNTSPTRTRSKPSSPSSSRMSPSNSRSGSAGGASEGMKRSSSAQSSDSSKVSALSGASSKAGGANERSGKPAGVMMAKRGRIGLAGAGAARPATTGAGGNSGVDGDAESQQPSSSSSTSTHSEKPLPSLPPPSSPSSPNPNGASSPPPPEEAKENEVDLDSIPVFDPSKFGAGRPHGRIPIPMEMGKDPETGEERMMAKQLEKE